MLPVELITGHPTIDAQHQQLIEAFENATNSYDQNSRELILESVEFLLNYTKEHFGTEEGLMTIIKYPNKDNHIKLHKEIVQLVEQVFEQSKDDSIPLFVIQHKLKKELFPALVSHIQDVDIDFVSHIKGA